MVLLLGLFGILVSETRRTAFNIGKVDGCVAAVTVAPLLRIVVNNCVIVDNKLHLEMVDGALLDIEGL